MSLAEILVERQETIKFNQLYYWKPYDFQKAFYHARGGETYESGQYALRAGKMAVDRAIISANQVGKTRCAAMEVAMHMTGEYPDWWEGVRFNCAVNVLVAGKTNDTTRDVCQKELLGNPKVPDALGTGTIPLRCLIGQPTRKAGVPLAFQAFSVRHSSGATSTAQLMAYEQGAKAFMGRNDYCVAWEDEEADPEVQSQIYRCFFAAKKYTIMMTFTPEEGMTDTVDRFLNHMQADQAVVRATWDDAPHMTVEAKESFLKKLPPHERDMRSKGIPLMGSGMVFPISEDDIIIEPIEIPRHWRRICGIDFGINHPFAAIWLAYDSESDVVYLIDEYLQTGTVPPVHASAIRMRSTWIPIIWPHDGLVRDKASGVPLADIYRKQEGLPLRIDRFTNPPAPGQEEGQGGFGVEVGIMEMWQRMETGRFRVFSTCQRWLGEFRQYHRKDGKIVALKDDAIDASRLAIMSLRHSNTEPVLKVRTNHRSGAKNW